MGRKPDRLPNYRTNHKLLFPIATSSTTTIVDSTTYYFTNWNVGLDTTTTVYPCYAPITGKIKGIDLNMAYAGTPTQENLLFYIRVNGVDTLVKTMGITALSPSHFSDFTLDIDVIRGQTLFIKMVTPAWVTNPTSMRLAGYLLMEHE